MTEYRLTDSQFIAALEWNGVGLWSCNPATGSQAGRMDTDDDINPSRELEADGYLLAVQNDRPDFSLVPPA